VSTTPPRRPHGPAELTHFDDGGAAHMVDVQAKPEVPRMARASGAVYMQAATLAVVRAGTAGKGDVLGVARVAGIAAAKSTEQMIPLCHPVRLTAVEVELTPDPDLPGVRIAVTVHAVDRTGPDMEAMTAVSATALTIYDMCKAVDRGMRIGDVVLEEKRGGKSGHWVRDATRP
jgi:cyclic pyranopterin phosphate synthase